MANDTGLAALPFQYFEIDQTIIIKRGRVELKISGVDAVNVLRPAIKILVARPTTLGELRSTSRHVELIDELVEQFARRRLLYIGASLDTSLASRPEKPERVFSWEIDAWDHPDRAKRGGYLVAGVNAITHEAVLSITATPFAGPVLVVDDPALRNIDFIDMVGEVSTNWRGPKPHTMENFVTLEFEASVLLAASDVGRQSDLLYWNAYCLRRNITFLPVTLRDWIGTIGPLTFPGETACLQCARTRQEALDENLDRRFEMSEAFPGVTGAHPSMAPILGHLASVELYKARILLPGARFAQILEVNVMASRVTSRTVLKVPRCRACGSVGKSPNMAIEASTYAGIS